jgi:D-alanyl-D-alanine carboxypeptidase
MAACEDPASAEHDTKVEQGLQQVLTAAVTKPGATIPGATTYYREPTHAAWMGSAGLGELTARVPMRPYDRIRAGSILKTFVATVTLQMVEEGKLALDQTLPALLPAAVVGRVPSAEQITLRMLLAHTSGIPEWVTDEIRASIVTNPGRIWTTDEVIDLAVGQPPWFPPGTSWRYSNTNYVLAGLVIDRAGGKGWRAEVRERLFAPLGLRASELPEPGTNLSTAGFAHGYEPGPDGGMLDLSSIDSSMAGASGGHALVTTDEDLARFLEALLAGRLFRNPATLTAMTTMIDAPHESGLPHRYGLGLEAFDFPGGTVIGHGGGTGGYTTMMYRIPARNTTLITTVNIGDMFANAYEVFVPSMAALAKAEAR